MHIIYIYGCNLEFSIAPLKTGHYQEFLSFIDCGHPAPFGSLWSLPPTRVQERKSETHPLEVLRL